MEHKSFQLSNWGLGFLVGMAVMWLLVNPFTIASSASSEDEESEPTFSFNEVKPVFSFTPSDVLSVCYSAHTDKGSMQELTLQVSLKDHAAQKLISELGTRAGRLIAFTFNDIILMASATPAAAKEMAAKGEGPKILIFSEAQNVSGLTLLGLAHYLNPQAPPSECLPGHSEPLSEAYAGYVKKLWSE